MNITEEQAKSISRDLLYLCKYYRQKITEIKIDSGDGVLRKYYAIKFALGFKKYYSISRSTINNNLLPFVTYVFECFK